MHNGEMHFLPDIPEYLDLLGLPFERGARGPQAYDCYGLVIEMHRRVGITLPDFETPGELEEISEIVSAEAARAWHKVDFGVPGSVVTFRVENVGAHVGFMISSDRFIHAIDGACVSTPRISVSPWDDKKLAAYIYG